MALLVFACSYDSPSSGVDPAGTGRLAFLRSSTESSLKGEWARRVLEEALERGKTDVSAVARLASLNAPTADIVQMLLEIDAGRFGAYS